MKVFHKFTITFILLVTFLAITLSVSTHAQDKCGCGPCYPAPCAEVDKCACRTCCSTDAKDLVNYEYGSGCVSRYASLDTDMSVYEVGEKVEIIFSNPKDCDFEFNRIYIQQLQSSRGGMPIIETIFALEDPQMIEPGTRWTWSWNQRDSGGNQVSLGRFMVIIETRCSETYRALFRVVQVCRPICPTECCCVCCPCDP